MNKISFDSNSLLEHLGIYDFLNVLLSGSTFVCGICIIDVNIKNYIFNNITFIKGFGISILIYILGLTFQELSSFVDEKILKIYYKMSCSILKGNVDMKCANQNKNQIVKNPIILDFYRKTVDKLYEDNIDYDDDTFNSFIFSLCQYYVSVCGKDKKVEKLRALVDMSITLMTCLYVLSIFSIFSIFIDFKTSVCISDIVTSFSNYNIILDKYTFAFLYFIIGEVFYFRSKRVMKNFLLVLLGTCNALVVLNEHEELTYKMGFISVRKKYGVNTQSGDDKEDMKIK